MNDDYKRQSQNAGIMVASACDTRASKVKFHEIGKSRNHSLFERFHGS